MKLFSVSKINRANLNFWHGVKSNKIVEYGNVGFRFSRSLGSLKCIRIKTAFSGANSLNVKLFSVVVYDYPKRK
jgi:hypothetical protein